MSERRRGQATSATMSSEIERIRSGCPVASGSVVDRRVSVAKMIWVPSGAETSPAQFVTP